MRHKYANNPIQDEFINPFDMKLDCKTIRENLDDIDNRQLVVRFKRTKDPINLAFETIDNISLKYLAKDFVKESFTDIVSFISKLCK